MDKFEYKVVTYNTKGFWGGNVETYQIEDQLNLLGMMDGRWSAVHPLIKVMARLKALCAFSKERRINKLQFECLVELGIMCEWTAWM